MRARIPALAGGISSPIARKANIWRPVGGCLAETLDRVLQIAGAPLGKRQRSVGHAPQLHPFLRAGSRYRPLEVGARLLGVKALGRARAEDRKRGRLVLRLGLELLVGALLERFDRRLGAALLDADLSLLGSHDGSFYGGHVSGAILADPGH